MESYQVTFTISRLWKILLASMLIMFSTLLYFGGEIYQKAPPMPTQVVSENGQLLFTGTDIQRGQNIWQSLGGMQKGSIWGHGSYLAPDWSADWLHRESVAMLEAAAQKQHGVRFSYVLFGIYRATRSESESRVAVTLNEATQGR